MAPTMGRMDEDAVFRALANPARRTIVAFLARLDGHARPVEAGEIAEEVFLHHHVTWPSTSKHLAVLRDAGVVAAWSHETYRFYRLRWAAVGAVRDWLDVVASAGDGASR